MKKLYKFELDYGRQGTLEGIFVSLESDFDRMIGNEVYFGEALGKHSEVSEVMTKDMFEEIDIPFEVLEILENKIGSTISGWNPVEMFMEEENEE